MYVKTLMSIKILDFLGEKLDNMRLWITKWTSIILQADILTTCASFEWNIIHCPVWRLIYLYAHVHRLIRFGSCFVDFLNISIFCTYYALLGRNTFHKLSAQLPQKSEDWTICHRLVPIQLYIIFSLWTLKHYYEICS